MGIALGIVLILVGAALTFAVDINIPGVSDDTLGIILMVVGALSIILAFALQAQRAHTSHTSRVEERRIEEP
ncbi:MAG: DUF6458 family protein [Nocardioidaceae bacterium]